ncbi:hypothetical protein LTR73_008684 [Friedmanniomyces endolithicus]|nr:hypothetical protein LTR73_008684 [Friedmanniomyces endolithicus]
MSIRDAARSELTRLSDDISLLRVENDSLKRGMQESSCGSRFARPNFEGEDMEVDSFPITGMMTPSASTWMSSTPPMVECSTAGLAVPVVTYATEDLSRARVENGHRGTRSSADREPSLEDSLMGRHAGRSHPASPEVPESVNSRDPPSSTTQETVVGNLADEFCTDKQESPSARGR